MTKLLFILFFIFSISPAESFNSLNKNSLKCRKNEYRPEVLYKKAKDAVVVIRTPTTSGSGFVIEQKDNATFILTNSHVIEDYENAAVIWSNKEINGANVQDKNGFMPYNFDPSNDLGMVINLK